MRPAAGQMSGDLGRPAADTISSAGGLHVLGPGALHALLPILTGERTDPAARLIAGALTPLSWFYIGGLKAYLGLYKTGLRRRHTLPCPVVSIGNLVSGGTGKTGLAITVARGLLARGIRGCILSRGFRGRFQDPVAIVSTGQEVLLGPAEAGDEPYLMAVSLPGVPVLVGRDRRLSGRLACERFKPDLILLDDGMQYYQLHRDVEIVLLNVEHPFGNHRTLPAGVLREPKSHLVRATCIVINGGDQAQRRSVERSVRALAPAAVVVSGCYEPVGAHEVPDGQPVPLDRLKDVPVVTVCGLGNPASFEQTVSLAGATIVGRFRLLDHRPPSPREAEAIWRAAMEVRAAALVISAKDAVKWPDVGGPLPVWALEAAFRLSDEEALFDHILRCTALNRPLVLQ